MPPTSAEVRVALHSMRRLRRGNVVTWNLRVFINGPADFCAPWPLTDQTTSRAGASVAVAISLLVCDVVLATVGFPATWQMLFSTVSNTVVVVLLFALKHTQGRQQTALQLELDEIIRALPAADDHLVQIERAEESELGEHERDQISVHESLSDSDSATESGKGDS